MRSSIACAIAVVAASLWTGASAISQCGVATDNFPSCPSCLGQALDDGLIDFWWNWDTHPKIDETQLTQKQVQEMQARFVPMLWGEAYPDDAYSFLSSGTYVMGYNEPDQYGPACVGSYNPPAYGCGLGEYRPATSSGWFALFDPSVGNAAQWHASHYWQQTVNNLTSQSAYPHPAISKIVSPSMAQGAKAGASCIGVDPSLPGNPKYCQGWLNTFKNYTLALDCKDMAGASTNCWDVIDAIQIHAYAKRPQDIIAKVQEYGTVFADDFAGTNGRKKKTLWITELAMGSDDATEIVSFIEELFSSSSGLANKSLFPYLEAVSWFSDTSFSAFNVSGVAPKPNEEWVSTLFNPYGGLNAVGEAFFKNCNGK